MAALDPELIERFRRDFEAAAGSPLGDGAIALAVSGGPDSMAMLALAQAAFPGGVVAATVDHGLRAESADEAAMVAGVCAEMGVPHAVFRLGPPGGGANLQAWAREERYVALRGWAVTAGAQYLATAHHADDQAETFLMRAARGSGLSGLAAIRARQELAGTPLTLVRPLLAWRRRELRGVVEALGMRFVDDPSNADERFDRTRFRKLLEANPWLDPAQIARSAAYVAEADADFRVLSDGLRSGRTTGDPDDLRIDVADLPRELRRRVARSAISAVRQGNAIDHPAWPVGANVEALLDALEAGGGATQAGVMASAKGMIWRFRPAPPRRSH